LLLRRGPQEAPRSTAGPRIINHILLLSFHFDIFNVITIASSSNLFIHFYKRLASYYTMAKNTIAYPLQPPAVTNDLEAIQDIPNHIVHAFQIHQENSTNSVSSSEEKDSSEEQDVDINYYERNFPIGSLLSFTLQSTSITLTPSDSTWDISVNPASFHVGAGAELILNSAALDPSFQGKNGHLSIFVSTDVNPDYTCICPFISRNRPVHELGVRVTGPALVQFALVNHYDDEEKVDADADFHSVNIFGNVKLCEDPVQQIVLKAKEQFLMMNELDADDDEDEDVQQVEYSAEEEQKVQEEVQIESPKKEVKETKQEELKTLNSAKKRKLSLDSKDDAPTDAPSSEPAKLTKKQRKLLAKKKEMELQKVVAKENNHEAKAEALKQVEKKNVSLTRPRMIEGGILIQDIIHGNGATVRTGRKVSIHYIGTFPETDKVFDKNNSKGNPLTWRSGTREVIRGLDQGLVGMKVGGERVINIPAKLGYGKKGSGNIPGGAKLCFAVKLLSVGAKK